jgi:ADP-ribose pyrophosphatase
MKETKIHSKPVYHSDFLTIEEDTVITSESIETKRIVIRHSGASAILPITDDGKIVLIKQFRYPIDAVTIEVPAGKLEANRCKNHYFNSALFSLAFVLRMSLIILG